MGWRCVKELSDVSLALITAKVCLQYILQLQAFCSTYLRGDLLIADVKFYALSWSSLSSSIGIQNRTVSSELGFFMSGICI